MPLHESLELRHCPGRSCIERAVAVHCSQLDNQPKKYKVRGGGLQRTGHRLQLGGQEDELWEVLWPLPRKLDLAGTKAAFPLVFVLL